MRKLVSNKKFLLFFILSLGGIFLGLTVLTFFYLKQNAIIKPSAQSSIDLFEYINPIEKSKLSEIQVAAWKVKIRTELFTDSNINKVVFNLFDGNTYEVERDEERMRELSYCDQTQCTWVGYISGRSCIVKHSVTGKCSPGENIIFVIDHDTVSGSIPAVVGVNRYAYSAGGMAGENGHFLFKLDPSKFGRD